MLLTESYKQLNAQLHRDDPTYGSSGHKLAPRVAELCEAFQTRDILDYGCGKRGLEKALGIPIQNYDPCIPGLDAPPKPADIVACSDVMEHIEPEHVDAVLADINRLTRKCAIFLIATRPALRSLPDGRNAHLIQENMGWWVPRLYKAEFRVRNLMDVRNQGHSIAFVAVLDKGA